MAASPVRQAYRAYFGKKKKEKSRRYVTLHGQVPPKSPETILHLKTLETLPLRYESVFLHTVSRYQPNGYRAHRSETHKKKKHNFANLSILHRTNLTFELESNFTHWDLFTLADP